MKSISEFARKPELIKIELDDPAVIEEFGDTVVFYMKDFVDINTYFDFFQSQSENHGRIGAILQKLILNEKGEPVLKEGEELPATLAVLALTKVNEALGKSKTKPSTNTAGDQPA
jgi:hypothetical protein